MALNMNVIAEYKEKVDKEVEEGRTIKLTEEEADALSKKILAEAIKSVDTFND